MGCLSNSKFEANVIDYQRSKFACHVNSLKDVFLKNNFQGIKFFYIKNHYNCSSVRDIGNHL